MNKSENIIPRSIFIQKEIVRILDTFTELTAELTNLEKQYNHCRDQLLSFEEGDVEWKTLGELGTVRMCKQILKSQTTSEGDIAFKKIGTFGKKPKNYISGDLYENTNLNIVILSLEKFLFPRVAP